MHRTGCFIFFEMPSGVSVKPTGTCRTSVSLASRVKEQVCLEKGPPLCNQGRNSGKHPHRRVNPLHGLACQVTRKIEGGDFKGAIQLTSSEDTIVNFDDATYSVLLSKHPALHPHTCIPSVPPAPVPILVSPGVILAAIRSFPNGSVVGLEKFKPQNLKDQVQGKETAMIHFFKVL